VLRPGGALLAGMAMPFNYIFDFNKLDQGIMEVRFSLPYSDIDNLPKEELEVYFREGNPLEWSHTLDEQIGGQLEAGFLLAGFYEDKDPQDILSKHMPTFFATRAVKPV